MNKNKFNAKQKVGKNTNRCLAKQKECNCSCTEMEKKNKVVEKTWTERLKTNKNVIDLSESLLSRESSEYSNIEFEQFSPLRSSLFLIIELRRRLKKLIPGEKTTHKIVSKIKQLIRKSISVSYNDTKLPPTNGPVDAANTNENKDKAINADGINAENKQKQNISSETIQYTAKINDLERKLKESKENIEKLHKKTQELNNQLVFSNSKNEKLSMFLRSREKQLDDIQNEVKAGHKQLKTVKESLISKFSSELLHSSLKLNARHTNEPATTSPLPSLGLNSSGENS